MIVAAAASVDVIVIVSAIYYWMLVRPGIRRAGSIVFVATLGVLHATYFYSDRVVLRAVVAGVCEAGLIGFVVLQIRRRGVSAESPFVLKLLTCELRILYYALFSWRAKPDVPANARAFTIHQRVGQAQLFGMLPLVCVLEIVPVHLVVNRWNPLAAWIVTAISIYGAIWLIGIARAFRLRPVLVGGDYLDLRYGLLFRLRVDRETIAAVRRAQPGDRNFAVPRKSEPTICIELARPMAAERLFGLSRAVIKVAVTPDDEPEFVRELTRLL